MDEKELKALLDGVAKENRSALKTELETATAGLMKTDELASKLEAMGLTSKAINDLTEAVVKQGSELAKFLKGKEEGEKMDLRDQIKKSHDAIKAAVNSNGKFEMSVSKGQLSIVEKTQVARASVSGSTMAMRLPEIGQIAYLGTKLDGLFRHAPVSPSSNGVIRYYDQNSITRNADSVAEGATKPESAITWIERTLNLEKIADSIPVTKEAFNDVYFIQSEIERLLNINLALKKDALLYAGDGISPNIKGVYTSAQTFSAAAYAGSVDQANIFDLMLTVKTDIESGRQSKYTASTVLLNPIDVLKMKLIKDSQGRYLVPPELGGLNIVESNQVTVNTMLVGDFRFGTIYDLEDVNVQMGWINDQFIKNAFTILAEERLGLLIRNVDATGFEKVTNVATALATLETA
jgi:HK97 family phage major capsid protein